MSKTCEQCSFTQLLRVPSRLSQAEQAPSLVYLGQFHTKASISLCRVIFTAPFVFFAIVVTIFEVNTKFFCSPVFLTDFSFSMNTLDVRCLADFAYHFVNFLQRATLAGCCDTFTPSGEILTLLLFVFLLHCSNLIRYEYSQRFGDSSSMR